MVVIIDALDRGAVASDVVAADPDLWERLLMWLIRSSMVLTCALHGFIRLLSVHDTPGVDVMLACSRHCFSQTHP